MNEFGIRLYYVEKQRWEHVLIKRKECPVARADVQTDIDKHFG